ncbi:6-phospho 3-hexuloisomerase [Streptomyces sp. WAC 04229]|uniref:6-phospho-3-hexuloisomerase n=1 Tax=Streptomyces sp. WAC 04229 TaxID=2203206 RepID=UPI000F735B99|nr:6-phospho-3-hexuloisomerase [Streptomyces sp. WAC 04229]RSN64743.1 6-phospho 3-hexuloisomerase [Streptomyces sp. WAC 04229]
MVDQDKDIEIEVSPADTAVGVDGPYASARRVVVRELDAMLSHVDDRSCAGLATALRDSRRIFVAGAGRSKLSAEGFAMRLMHLGLCAHVVGDVTTPPIGPDDLLVVCSGSGETPTTVMTAETAADAGAKIAVVTASADSRLARRADLLVHLAEYGQDHELDRSVQFVGTLFEQGALLFFDSLVLAYERLHKVDPRDMLALHTNLE